MIDPIDQLNETTRIFASAPENTMGTPPSWESWPQEDQDRLAVQAILRMVNR